MRAVLASLALLGCAPPASGPSAPAAPPHVAAGESAHPAPGIAPPRALAEVPPIPSCSDVGPRSCGGPPSPIGSFCPAAAECARRFPTNSQGALPFADCEKVVDETPAPPGSGVEATGIVALRGREDEDAVATWQATALLARYPNGVCVVDSLFDWAFLHGGWFETELTYTWSNGEDGASLLEISGRLNARQTLDHGEIDAGVSDLSYALCKRATYWVKGGRFRRLTDTRDLCATELDSR